MSKEEENKQNFQELIEKYLDGQTTLEELKLLVNYYESYQQEHTWSKELGSEEATRNRVLINILEELQNGEKDNTKIVPFYQKSIFKYAVAASFILLISLPFIIKNNDKNVIAKPEVVNTINTNIKIGTDKATLTLDDGSQIILEKGESFKSENVNSSGEKIIYESGNKKKTEIVYNYLTIPRGGQFQIVLSDGTQVWLNSESQLKYPVNFISGEPRKVELVYGEAYFDVSPSTEHNGARFLVFNESQEVEVIGTEFNVKAYKDESNIYTTLVEGKVAVSFGNQYDKLIPGQQSNLNLENKIITITKVDVYEETSWRNGIFSFRGKPLKDIMKVISRWYDVEVIFENKQLEEITFKGVLGKNQDIQEILETIKSLSIIKTYEINDRKIILN